MFYLGVDLGQRRDHTALAVLERRVDTLGTPTFLVRHLERVPLGTPYPRVVARVREVVECDELAGQCAVAVDGTGVGAPVVDLLRDARLGCEISAVTITGGEREHLHGHGAGNVWSVPKRDLIAGVQVLLDRGDLKIARGLREAGSMVRELLNVRITGVRIGADGSGEHDDLVIALALACWRAQKGQKAQNGFGKRRLF